MKTIVLLAAALALLCATTADAKHRHHRGSHAQHIAVPLPQPRPAIRDFQTTEDDGALPQHIIYLRLYSYGLWRLENDQFLREVKR